MSGWSWRVWLAKQADQLKTIITILSGLAGAWIGQHLAGEWASLAGVGVAILTRLALDALHFWLADNPI